MPTLWPAVVDRLVELLPTLDGWTDVEIYDGPPVTLDVPLQYVTVGWVDNEEAGVFDTAQAMSGFETTEQGDVRCQLVCQSGDDDPPLMRAQAFALLDALSASLAADRTLGGVLPPQSMVSLASTVQTVRNQQGSAQTITFAVHYYATH